MPSLDRPGFSYDATAPRRLLTSHPSFIGRVDRMGHRVQIRRSVVVVRSAGCGVKSLDARERVGAPAERIISTSDGAADAAQRTATGDEHLVTAMARVAAPKCVPSCLWAGGHSIPVLLSLPA